MEESHTEEGKLSEPVAGLANSGDVMQPGFEAYDGG